MHQSEIVEFSKTKSESDELRDCLRQIIGSTWVMRTPGYHKVLIKNEVLKKARRLAYG